MQHLHFIATGLRFRRELLPQNHNDGRVKAVVVTTSDGGRSKQVADAVQRSWGQMLPTVVYSLPSKKLHSTRPSAHTTNNRPGTFSAQTAGTHFFEFFCSTSAFYI